MQAAFDTTDASVLHAYGKRTLGSYDSGEEFSIYRLVEVCRLVEQGDVTAQEEGLPQCEADGGSPRIDLR